MFGKTTQSAMAAMTLLAERYDRGDRLSTTQITRERDLAGPFVAKLLAVLSHARLVKGVPGPGGGYQLARPPHDIRLHEIYELFEPREQSPNCLFRGGPCDETCPCPMHHQAHALRDEHQRLLRETTLEVFQERAPQKDGRTADDKPRPQTVPAPNPPSAPLHPAASPRWGPAHA